MPARRLAAAAAFASLPTVAGCIAEPRRVATHRAGNLGFPTGPDCKILADGAAPGIEAPH